MSWYSFYIILYFAIMFSIGFYYFKKVKDADDYLIAGWNMGFWPIVGTIISTFCGAAVFIGWVGMGYNVGISGYVKFGFVAAAFSIIFVLLFAEPLRRQKLYTMADLFSERFGARIGLFPSILSAFVYAVPTLALQMVGMATIWTTIFGITTKLAIWLSFALILGFTILGGLPGTIITDAIQSALVIAGILLLTVASIRYGGGISEIVANSDRVLLTPFGADGPAKVMIYAFSVGPFYLLWQATWQRIFASKTVKIAKRACTLGFAVCGVIAFLPFFIGIAVRQYIPEGIAPDMIFSYITKQLLPPSIGGLVYTGLLAALMTGADSYILQGSSNLTRDIYQRFINPKADNRQMMRMSRLTVVLISALGLLVSFKITDITSMYQWALRMTATVLLFPFLAIMFWKRVTKAGAFCSMSVAAVVTAVWPYLETGIDVTLAGFTASLSCLVVVSLFTEHSDTEQVKAIYFEDFSV